MTSVDGSRSMQLTSDAEVSTRQSSVRITCDCGQNSEAVFYCETHDDVICSYCKTLKHKACKVMTFKEKGQGYVKTKFDSLLKKANVLKALNDNLSRERKTDLEFLGNSKANCMEKIRMVRKELNDLLNDIENNTRAQLDVEESLKRQTLEDHISVSETIAKLIETDIENLQEAKAVDDAADLFATDVKITKRLDHYSSSLSDVLNNSVPTNLALTINTDLIETLKKFGNLGTAVVETSELQTYGHETEESKLPSFQDENKASIIGKTFRFLVQVQLFKSGKNENLDISGCEFMPNGEVVLCDHSNNTVLVLNRTFSFVESKSLEDKPFGISSVNDKTAAITLPFEQTLQFINIKPKLKTARKVILDKRCWGIKVVNDNIYVTCHSSVLFGRGDGEVRVLDLAGNPLRKMGIKQNGPFMFSYPEAVTVSTVSGKVFVSDDWDNAVTCLSSAGDVVYKKSDISNARGIYVDDEDNIMVCSRSSNTVQIITAEGKPGGYLLTAAEGITKPKYLAFRQSDSVLIVGCGNTNKLVTMVMG